MAFGRFLSKIALNIVPTLVIAIFLSVISTFANPCLANAQPSKIYHIDLVTVFNDHDSYHVEAKAQDQGRMVPVYEILVEVHAKLLQGGNPKANFEENFERIYWNLKKNNESHIHFFVPQNKTSSSSVFVADYGDSMPETDYFVKIGRLVSRENRLEIVLDPQYHFEIVNRGEPTLFLAGLNYGAIIKNRYKSKNGAH